MQISRSRISFALILIGLGGWLLAVNLLPEARAIAIGYHTWPLQVIGLGAFFALVGLMTWTPGWFIPASIVAGIGGLLYYQVTSGDWASWAYAWTLIPAFVAVGLALLALFTWQRGPIVAAGWTLFASLILFWIFGSLLGGLELAGYVGPAAVILLGLMILLTPLLKRVRS